MSNRYSQIARALRGKFVVSDLGAGGDTDSLLPAEIKKSIILITVDAGDTARYSERYFAYHAINCAVADQPGRRTFRKNQYVGCSSLLPPKQEIIATYGLESLFQVDRMIEVECKTLLQILAELNLSALDFLKTDLEGLDLDVIQSFAPKLEHLLAVYPELRFQPAYQGEPTFHEAVAFLESHGFELVALSPAYWKYKTRHRNRHQDGRIVFADCLFLKRPEHIEVVFSPADQPLAYAKQIVIACMLGKTGLAEFLLERHGSVLPVAWRDELQALVVRRRFDLRSTRLWRAAWFIKRRFSRFDFGFIADRS